MSRLPRLPLILLIVLIAVLAMLAHAYWRVTQTGRAIAKQNQFNQELVYRNASVQADIEDLKNGSEAIQERARMHLGMIRKDEVFVQIMDQPSSSPAHPNANPNANANPLPPAADAKGK